VAAGKTITEIPSRAQNCTILGNYTAILAGKSGGVGVALVEVYNLH
jgi:hypothetical protein